MLRKLAGYPRQKPVARALHEIERVERTLFMLDWLDDADLRRRTNSNLSKGEARARSPVPSSQPAQRLSELCDRNFGKRRDRASGLNLIVSAIILWNTGYLDRAIRHSRDRGIDVPDTLLAHIAPLGWEQIRLTGDYLWSEIDKPRERFRPLRTTASAIRP